MKTFFGGTSRRSSQSIPVGLSEARLQAVDSDAGRLYMPLEDEVMRMYIRHRGTWEPEIGRLILAALRGVKDPVFVDVGANVGYFSCLAVRHVSDVTVHAFEPHPRLVPVLRLNCWESAGRVRVWPLALTAGTRTVILSTGEHNLGDTRSLAAEDGQSVDVVAPAAPLDELMTQGSVDVVKIDVQGSEHLVVEGMLQTLHRSRDPLLIVEFGLDTMTAAQNEPAGVLQAYRSMGFDVQWLHKDGLSRPSDEEILRAAASAGPEGQLNLVLRKRERA